MQPKSWSKFSPFQKAMLEVIVLRKQAQQVKKSHPGEESHVTYAPGSKLPNIEDGHPVIPPFIGNPYTGVDDHPYHMEAMGVLTPAHLIEG